MEHDVVTLETLGHGACLEKFDDELKKVIENILDPNTTDAAREITLKVKIKPDETRQVCITDIIASSKLAPAKSFRTALFVGKEKGVAIATEPNPGQVSLKGANVTSLLDKGGK